MKAILKKVTERGIVVECDGKVAEYIGPNVKNPTPCAGYVRWSVPGDSEWAHPLGGHVSIFPGLGLGLMEWTILDEINATGFADLYELAARECDRNGAQEVLDERLANYDFAALIFWAERGNSRHIVIGADTKTRLKAHIKAAIAAVFSDYGRPAPQPVISIFSAVREGEGEQETIRAKEEEVRVGCWSERLNRWIFWTR